MNQSNSNATFIPVQHNLVLRISKILDLLNLRPEKNKITSDYHNMDNDDMPFVFNNVINLI